MNIAKKKNSTDVFLFLVFLFLNITVCCISVKIIAYNTPSSGTV